VPTVVSLAETSFLDSTVISVIYTLALNGSSGSNLVLHIPPDGPVCRTLEIAGVETALVCQPTLPEALLTAQQLGPDPTPSRQSRLKTHRSPRTRGHGIGELHPICPKCAMREFGHRG
jgi:hypothetical protein